MSNLLTPPGLIRRSAFCRPPTYTVPHAHLDAMPGYPGAFIETDRGIRRLLPEETARGLGVPKEFLTAHSSLDPCVLKATTSVFHWEFLSEAIAKLTCTGPQLTDIASGVVDATELESPSTPSATHTPFEYTMPDLSEGGPWFCDRVAHLKAAVAEFPNPEEIIAQGLDMLRIHRGNYTKEGPDPKQLQLLWWEFPREHWTLLREGASMNFLCEPVHGIHPNAPMDDEQKHIAAQFVDELVALNVLRPADPDSVLSTTPLFVIQKEGQPGEWRVIANMLEGGQNQAVGSDPVFLPRTAHILDLLYTGGYSAVVDASKFFYQFPTHPDDHPYLGLVHPITGILLTWGGCPMGAGNSPATAGRCGLSFLRLLRERYSVFQGRAAANCFWTGFHATGEYHPDLGYGYVLLSADGPAVRLWVHVDDFLIHGPTEEKTAQALTFFLDTAVACGMLCHPKKLVPPTQVVKYCGFLLDTQAIPCLRVPVAKRERALAMIDTLVDSPSHSEFSRLALAVVAGVLQSLCEATPAKLGNSYLRRLHSCVHPPGYDVGAAVYYSFARIDEEIRADLRWWRQYLLAGEGRFARSLRAATLAPNWGDGSGTGTGGTLGIPNQPLRMWKGKWSPIVFHFTSTNFKELSTLLLTMEALRDLDPDAVRGTSVFYFTDNSPTYWIAASGTSPHPRLHRLIEAIRQIELELGCHLQVVHVPGLAMITQGTDSLSRGVWMTPFNSSDPVSLTQHVFAPAVFDAALVNSICHDLSWPAEWRLQPWDSLWVGSQLLGTTSVWFPPPELARQALTFTLETWVERPRDTRALFFVPRIVPSFWMGLSRFVEEVTTIYPHETALRFPPVLPIPIVVLCWSHLPFPNILGSTGVPPRECVGCRRDLSPTNTPLTCSFASTGFPFSSGVLAAPCRSLYHTQCLRVGPPFYSRRNHGGGLVFPDIRTWPQFICEACTVRAVLDRELTDPADWRLLCLERMRLLDMAHSWASNTHELYQNKLLAISRFGHEFGVPLLHSRPLLCPPVSDNIPLMWMQEAYSLRMGSSRRNDPDAMAFVAFATVRQLRSAASQYFAWDAMLRFPDQAYENREGRILCSEFCRPTDTLAYTWFSTGMSARIGDKPNPSTALLHRHVVAMDKELAERYRRTTNPLLRIELARAGLCNLLFWLGWLRSSENLSLSFADVDPIPPREALAHDLPLGVGCLVSNLQSETKSLRTSRADVVVAWRTVSGLRVGRWWQRLCTSFPLESGPLFCHPDGTPWTSRYFRETFLYPSLRRQRAAGDPFLRAFDDHPGNRLEDKFWSLHCYRRGARSQATRGPSPQIPFRRASKEQMYEHARWRLQRSGEAVDVLYREWTLRDRVRLTLFCM